MKLKPCPFCGSKEVNFIGTGHRVNTLIGVVMCHRCLAKAQYGIPQDEAIEAWNTRTPDPHQSLKDELLRVKDDYIRLLSYEAGRVATIGVTHPQFAPAPETIDEGIAMRRNIADLEAKLKGKQGS